MFGHPYFLAGQLEGGGTDEWVLEQNRKIWNVVGVGRADSDMGAFCEWVWRWDKGRWVELDVGDVEIGWGEAGVIGDVLETAVAKRCFLPDSFQFKAKFLSQALSGFVVTEGFQIKPP